MRPTHSMKNFILLRTPTNGLWARPRPSPLVLAARLRVLGVPLMTPKACGKATPSPRHRIMNSGDHLTAPEFFPPMVYVSKHIGLEFVRFSRAADQLRCNSRCLRHGRSRPKLDYAFSVAFSFLFWVFRWHILSTDIFSSEFEDSHANSSLRRSPYTSYLKTRRIEHNAES